jgi:hypothetical protein
VLATQAVEAASMELERLLQDLKKLTRLLGCGHFSLTLEPLHPPSLVGDQLFASANMTYGQL